MVQRGRLLSRPLYFDSFTVVLGCFFAYPGVVYCPVSARRYFGGLDFELVCFLAIVSSFLERVALLGSQPI